MVKRAVLGGVALLAAAGVTGAMGCAVIAGLDKNYHPSGSGGGGAAGSGGTTTTTDTAGGTGGTGGTGSGTGGSTCTPLHPPSAPAVQDDGGNIEFVVALHSIDVGEASFDVKIGFDLDGLCTCTNNAPGSCTPIANTVCDGPGGIDNALSLIFATVKQQSAGLVTSGQLSKAANDGRWTGLARVRGYNGKPDDAKVEVLGYSTQGVAAGMPKPIWDGTDKWPVDDSSLADGKNVDNPIVKSIEAYVTGGVLVARFSDQLLRIKGDLFGMDIHIKGFAFAASIENANGLYKLTKGVLMGKWPLSTAFADLASIRYGGSNKLCTDQGTYTTVKAAICGDADLTLDGQPGTCDALSFGANFTSDAAMLGAVVPGPAPPADGCAPDKDPAGDNCSK
jgi:hypothetical protein